MLSNPLPQLALHFSTTAAAPSHRFTSAFPAAIPYFLNAEAVDLIAATDINQSNMLLHAPAPATALVFDGAKFLQQDVDRELTITALILDTPSNFEFLFGIQTHLMPKPKCINPMLILSADDAQFEYWANEQLPRDEQKSLELTLTTLTHFCIQTLHVLATGLPLGEVTPTRREVERAKSTFRKVKQAYKPRPYKVLHLTWDREGTPREGTPGEGTSGEGTPRTVRPHFRRGHIRRLPSGATTWVRPTFIHAPVSPTPTLVRP